ncbi:3'5' exonuclease domain containing protein [Acanthamoeba castellanii str. Neff]|uniref:3'5' exonuclease domain containing protein n=1 Tax=Acanthamoeba castellanii (strain ATCC 30010 / Neff) TaxID=1257118 RepID=L8GRY3_ACACF|nr:3'5' exonuclease domain containing protein [Acanthamoeba castellanii str. Neff]ELR14896.1 3'5' exonuclease domain containing protein [Acanthamoeba castellanii str. Neff]
MPDYTLITEPHQVADVAERFVAKAQWLAIDTESNILFVYQPRVCLIQMNVEGVLLVFDTMALMQADPLALEPLRPYLEDGQRLIFAHGAANDVSTFKRDFDISLNGLFDTQRAAQLAGLAHTNYGAVVESLLSVSLSKDYTHYNWGLRPIELEPLRYALEDVVYLPQVGHMLRARVQELGVEEELAAVNRMLMAMPSHPRRLDDLALVHSIRGTGNLDPVQLGVMGALFLWRDAKAREFDRPCGSVISNERLVKIARALDPNVPPRPTSNVRTVRRKCLEPQPPPNQEEGEEEDGGEEAEEDEEEEAPPAPPEQQGR